MSIFERATIGTIRVKPEFIKELRMLLIIEASSLLRESEEHQRRWLASQSDSDTAKRRRCMIGSDTIGQLITKIALPFAAWKLANAEYTIGETSDILDDAANHLEMTNPNDATDEPR